MSEATHTAPVEATASSSQSKPFAANVPQITNLLESLTTDAASLPGRSDLQFHRTLDRKFAKDLDRASDSVLALTRDLVKLLKEDGKGPAGGKGKSRGSEAEVKDEEDLTEHFRKTIGGTIDALLEDADAKIDEASGANKASAVAIDPRKAAAAAKKLPGPFADPMTASRLPNNITHAQMTKPQATFPDQANNDPSYVWRPTLAYKAHAMVPLGHINPAPPMPKQKIQDASDELRKIQDREWDRYKRACKQRAHPYFFETEHLPYPTRMFEIAPPIPPRPLDQQEAILVDTSEALSKMTEALKASKEIAVDLEYHSSRSYYGFTCLMQISTREEDFIVDTLKLRGELREDKLGGVMADPNIVKVFHGAESDVLWLQQDFDIYLVNLFDTYHATHVLNHLSHSLAGLLTRYADFAADKRYQLADWRIRPLPREMLQYAQSDTHFLLYIYDHLRNELLAMASRPPSPAPAAANEEASGSTSRQHTPETNPQRSLRRVLEASADTALGVYSRDNYDPVTGKGSGGWRMGRKKFLAKAQYGTLEGLVFIRMHQWRDRVARELDESPHWWLPNDYIRNIAVSPLSSTHAISRILARPTRSREHIGAHACGQEVATIVQAAKKEFPTLTLQQKMAMEATIDVEKEREALAFLGEPSGGALSGSSATAGAKGKEIRGSSPAAAMTAHGQSQATSPPAPVAKSHAKGSKPVQSYDDLWASIGQSANAAASAASPNGTGTTAPKRGAKKGSALFGKTIPAARPTPASYTPSADAPKPQTKKKSALFGKALPGTVKAGAKTAVAAVTPAQKQQDTEAARKAFEEAQRSILSDVGAGVLPFLAPVQPAANATSASVSVSTLSAASSTAAVDSGVNGRAGTDKLKGIAAKHKTSTASTPSSSAQRVGALDASTLSPGAAVQSATVESTTRSVSDTTATPAPAPAPAVKAKKDDIVQVKRKKAKVKHTPATPAAPLASDDTSAPATAAASAPKAKKAKVKSSLSAQTLASAPTPDNAGGQAMFDYAAQPDFLSASHQRHLVEGGRDREKADEEARKSKKAKKKAKANGPPTSMIETPDFGPRPRDMTQPKAGSRSHTFTS